MARITKPEKWKDSFFLSLKPLEKLIFIYIYENCDNAGFLDINFNRMANDIGMSEDELIEIFKSKKLEKAYILNNDSTKLWLKKFLLHQNKLPLDLKTEEGNYIKFSIQNNFESFNCPIDFDNIIKDVKKGGRAKKVKVEFVKPKLEEVIDKFKTGEFSYIPIEEIKSIYIYYEGVGWKVGRNKKPMEDWEKAFMYCFRNNDNNRKYKSNNGMVNNNVVQTRLDMIVEQNEKIENFDYSQLQRKQ